MLAWLAITAAALPGCGKKAPAEAVPAEESFDTMDVYEESRTESPENVQDPGSGSNSATPGPTEEAESLESYDDAIGVVDAAPKSAPIAAEPGKELVSDSGITIIEEDTALSAIMGRGITFTVKNENDFPVRLAGDSFIINDYTSDASISWDLEAGEELPFTVYANQSFLDSVGITSVYTMVMDVTAYNTETYAPIWEHAFVLDTGNEPYESTPRGELLYESGRMRVYGEYVTDDPEWGSGLLITVRNLTDGTVFVRAKEAYADGLYMKEGLNICCRPGTYGIAKQNYTEKILKENGQDSFSTAGIVLDIWEEGAESPCETTERLEVPTTPAPDNAD